MSLSTEQKADINFKKIATDKATTALPTAFFEEPINSRRSVLSSDVWNQSDSIPATAAAVPTIVEQVTNLQLTHIPGSNSLAFTDVSLVDVIPFNFGDGSSYIYTLETDAGDPIPFGLNDWYLDPEAGVLTFFSGFPSGVSPTLPPKISCYKYIGTKGVGSAGSSAWENLSGILKPVADTPAVYGIALESNTGPVKNFSLTQNATNVIYETDTEHVFSVSTNNRLTLSDSQLTYRPSTGGFRVFFNDDTNSEAIKFFMSTTTSEIQMINSGIVHALKTNADSFLYGTGASSNFGLGTSTPTERLHAHSGNCLLSVEDSTVGTPSISNEGYLLDSSYWNGAASVTRRLKLKYTTAATTGQETISIESDATTSPENRFIYVSEVDNSVILSPSINITGSPIDYTAVGRSLNIEGNNKIAIGRIVAANGVGVVNQAGVGFSLTMSGNNNYILGSAINTSGSNVNALGKGFTETRSNVLAWGVDQLVFSVGRSEPLRIKPQILSADGENNNQGIHLISSYWNGASVDVYGNINHSITNPGADDGKSHLSLGIDGTDYVHVTDDGYLGVGIVPTAKSQVHDGDFYLSPVDASSGDTLKFGKFRNGISFWNTSAAGGSELQSTTVETLFKLSPQLGNPAVSLPSYTITNDTDTPQNNLLYIDASFAYQVIGSANNFLKNNNSLIIVGSGNVSNSVGVNRIIVGNNLTATGNSVMLTGHNAITEARSDIRVHQFGGSSSTRRSNFEYGVASSLKLSPLKSTGSALTRNNQGMELVSSYWNGVNNDLSGFIGHIITDGTSGESALTLGNQSEAQSFVIDANNCVRINERLNSNPITGTPRTESLYIESNPAGSGSTVVVKQPSSTLASIVSLLNNSSETLQFLVNGTSASVNPSEANISYSGAGKLKITPPANFDLEIVLPAGTGNLIVNRLGGGTEQLNTV